MQCHQQANAFPQVLFVITLRMFYYSYVSNHLHYFWLTMVIYLRNDKCFVIASTYSISKRH